MRQTLRDLGGSSTRVIDNLPEGKRPELAVVLAHGFGASKDDLVPIGGHMLQTSPKLSQSARFYFPGGPLDLSEWGMYGAAAWWMIDMDAIQRAMRDGGFRDRMRDERPEGLLQARAAMLKLVQEVRDETGLGLDRIVLGGFSQGSMLTVDVALQLPENVAALVAWSGTLLNEAEWRALAAGHKGLKVVQSHGRQDPMLPYAWAEYLRDELANAGLDVEFLPFEGGHTIPAQAEARTRQVLEQACP